MLNPCLVRLSRREIDRTLRERPIRPPPGVGSDALVVAISFVIFRVRWRAGLTQGQLAHRLGLDRSTVCRWEAGTRVPTLLHLAQLADLTHQPLSAVLFEVEELIRETRRARREATHAAAD